MNPQTSTAANHNRAANLRQRLLRASRIVNTVIVENLRQHGFTELKSTHTTLLSNLDLQGNSLTVVAQRAGMSKQAMGRLADELVELGYITRTQDENDKRAVKIEFTSAGLGLMKQSFSIMEAIEDRCAQRIGERQYKNLLAALEMIVDEMEVATDKK